MSIKLIAVGNRLMGDDAIAIHIAEKLSPSFDKYGIEVIIGETDFQYCLNRIEENDYIILIDATWFDIKPGTVTVKRLRDIHNVCCNQNRFSQHGYSLISSLATYYPSIEGLLIGIEGRSFDFSLTLSRELETQFQNICNKVEALCKGIL